MKGINRKTTIFYLIVCAALSLTLAGCSVIRGGKMKPTIAVTTSIKDALPVASWLDYYSSIRSPDKGTSFDLAPGYYTFEIQSYCLKAGKYAPTGGEGYLIAPLKGERAGIIRNILRRSVEHPEIKQHDIQRLIWGIETGAKFNNFDISYQLRMMPLLTPEEIAILSVDYIDVLSFLLPDEIKNAAELYKKLRDKVTDIRTTYEELERLAVLFGEVPLGPGSRNIGPGPWAYVGNGFYMLALPSGYPETTLEVIRPAPYTLERDSKGRIVVFRSGLYRIETSYDDSTSANVVSSPGKPDIYIWRFKKIRFLGPNPDDELTVENQGWILASPHHQTTPPASASLEPSPIDDTSLAIGSRILMHYSDDIPDEWNQAKGRVDKAKEIKDLIDKIDYYREREKHDESPPSEEAIKDLTDLSHYREGLEKAVDPADFEGRSEWLTKHFNRVQDAFNYCSCVLAGDCPPPGEQPRDINAEWDDTESFDPTGHVATPANTNQQRLGASKRQ